MYRAWEPTTTQERHNSSQRQCKQDHHNSISYKQCQHPSIGVVKRILCFIFYLLALKKWRQRLLRLTEELSIYFIFLAGLRMLFSFLFTCWPNSDVVCLPQITTASRRNYYGALILVIATLSVTVMTIQIYATPNLNPSRRDADIEVYRIKKWPTL